MSKARATNSASPPVSVSQSQQNSMISTQTAIYMLNAKIQKIEEVMKLHMDDIENKFGEHEAYVTDNIPDLDLINKALSDINTRLIDLESLETRISALENGGRVASPSVATTSLSPVQTPSPTPAPSKKKGTVKLADITPAPVIEPGISFS